MIQRMLGRSAADVIELQSSIAVAIAVMKRQSHAAWERGMTSAYDEGSLSLNGNFDSDHLWAASERGQGELLAILSEMMSDLTAISVCAPEIAG